jgi:hypothetical protein
MYERFCIKFLQSRMKGERHRLSPLSLLVLQSWFETEIIHYLHYIPKTVLQSKKYTKIKPYHKL